MKKIAINIITKDNEPYLKKTLDCIKGLDPEYVIVYNGKKESKELNICNEYSNNVYIKKWNQDFSELRNFAIEQTKSPWILWIDSDEFINTESIHKIKKLINSKPQNNYLKFKLIQGNSTLGQIRMFRNIPSIRWKFKVHEKIIPDNIPEYHPKIEINHIINNVQDSQNRNISILKKELKSTPNDPEYLFYASIEFHMIGHHMKSLIYAEKFLFHYPIKEVDARKMYIRYLIAWIYTFQLRNYQKSLQIMLGQLILNCNIAEFWCLLGDTYIHMGKYDCAKQYFHNAILMGKYKYDNMWITDLEKYDQYPKMRIEQCEKHKNIDIKNFEQEISSPLIP